MADKNKTREVDLFDLFASIGKAIKNIVLWAYDAVLWAIFFGIKRYIVIAVFIGIGLVIGIISSIEGEPVYEAGMLIRTNAIPSSQMSRLLNSFSDDFKNRDTETLNMYTSLFGTDSTELKNVVDISTHYVIDFYNDGTIDKYDLNDQSSARDTINVQHPNYLYIQAKVLDKSVLPYIQKGIISFIEGNDYVQMSEATRQIVEQQEIDLYDYEIAQLDSLQKATYYELSPGIKFESNQLMVGDMRKQLVHHEKISLRRKALDILDESKKFKGPVSVIIAFPKSPTLVRSNTSNIINSIIKWAILGYLLALLWYFYNKVKGKYMARID